MGDVQIQARARSFTLPMPKVAGTRAHQAADLVGTESATPKPISRRRIYPAFGEIGPE